MFWCYVLYSFDVLDPLDVLDVLHLLYHWMYCIPFTDLLTHNNFHNTMGRAPSARPSSCWRRRRRRLLLCVMRLMKKMQYIRWIRSTSSRSSTTSEKSRWNTSSPSTRFGTSNQSRQSGQVKSFAALNSFSWSNVYKCSFLSNMFIISCISCDDFFLLMEIVAARVVELEFSCRLHNKWEK